MTATESIRVASIPAGHPYVQHLSPLPGHDHPAELVCRLTDPRPAVASPAPGQWWPPRMLEQGWVTDRHCDFDLMHLHFGFDAAEPETLHSWVDELNRAHRPLVMTVHDLVNPHFVDQERHLAQLQVLIPRADELITLTEGAATEINRRWGRAATVIPHPHIVPLQQIPASRPSHPRFVIGVNAKNLRANIEALPVLQTLRAAISGIPEVLVQVDLHQGLPTDPSARAVDLMAWLKTVDGDPQFRTLIRPRLSDEQLFSYLRSVDLSILPYRFGTHSGWLEACVDVSTKVLVPDTGFYGEQHGHPTFGWSGPGPDSDELEGLVTKSLLQPDFAQPIRPDRRAQRGQIAGAHLAVYRSALGR